MNTTMNVNSTNTKTVDTRTLLSTLWIVVMFNMVAADVLSLYIPGALDEVSKTAVSMGVSIPLLMLSGAVLEELSIIMILLSRVLRHSINRWGNVIVSIFTIVFVVGGGSKEPHYFFFAGVEVICLLLVIFFACKWRRD